MNEVIVKFENGQYAMRKGFFFYSYRDMKVRNSRMWWGKNHIHFKDCLMGSKESLLEGIKFQEEQITAEESRKTDYGTPVK